MAKSLINLGTTPNDRTGDTLRDAGSKVNSNINELYTALGNGTTLQVNVSGATTGQVLKYNGTSFVPQTDLNTDAVLSVNTKVGAVVLNTDDVAEGTTNKYFSNALARAAISTSNGGLSYNSTTGVISFTQGNTDTVPEGTNNQYYTAGRFDFRLSQKTTNDLAEGSNNHYFTNARARSAISATQNITYDAASGIITGPQLATVATSGSYNDLTDKPSLGSTTQWTVDSSGSALNFTGNGFLGTEDNPTIYVYRGMRYEFNNQSGSTVEIVDAITKGVRSVSISDGGSYSTAPTVSFTGGTGSGAAGTAVLSTAGSIDTIAVTDGGSGYTTAPTISATVGTGLIATATLSTTGTVESVDVTDGGSNYSVAPAVSFTATSGSGAAATATLGFPIAPFSVTNGGSGYTTASVVVTGDGTGAAGTANIVGGEIVSITLTDGGSGYTTAPTVTITGDGTGATATADLQALGSVKSVTVTAQGTGYSSDVAAVFTADSGDTFAVDATADVVRGLSIESIAVTNGGSGYTTASTITITPAVGDVVAQTATASKSLKFPVASVTITNPGTYTVAPSVAFSTGTAAATAGIDLKLVPASQDFTAATAANNASTFLAPLMSTTTGTKWKYRLVGDEENQVGDIVVV